VTRVSEREKKVKTSSKVERKQRESDTSYKVKVLWRAAPRGSESVGGGCALKPDHGGSSAGDTRSAHVGALLTGGGEIGCLNERSVQDKRKVNDRSVSKLSAVRMTVNK
jgi:hypothetical protein